MIKNILTKYIFNKTNLKFTDMTFVGSFIHYLLDTFGHTSSKLKKINLENIKNNWKKNYNNDADETILIDYLNIHPFPIIGNNTVLRVLSEKSKYNVVGITKYSNGSLNQINSFFGINNIISLYRFLNVRVIYNSITYLCKNIKYYNSEISRNKPPEILVDGENLGDFIYDDVLAYYRTGTLKKVNVVYLLHIYKAFYYYFRYKQLLKEIDNLSTIIVSEMAYIPHMTLLYAAKVINPNIKVWILYLLQNTQLSNFLVKDVEYRVRKLFKEKYLDQILVKYNHDEIEKQFTSHYELRKKGIYSDVCNQFLVNKKTITCPNEFKKEYNYSTEKKNVFVFAHGMLDSVRYVPELVYLDYYTWLKETLEILSKNKNVNVYVKAHPCEELYQCSDSAKSVVKEINSYLGNKTNIVYLNSVIDKHMIFKLADSIVTCNGTVALEAPAFKIPVVVASGYYKELQSVYTYGKEYEYKKALLNIHNINLLDENLAFFSKVAFLWYDKFTNSTNMSEGLGDDDYFLSPIEQYLKLNSLYKNEDVMANSILNKDFEYMYENNLRELLVLND